MRRVAIIGAGMTPFGEHWEKGLKELIAEAGAKAIVNANISGKEIDAIYGGNMSGGAFVGQEHVGALIADYMGLTPVPSIRVEAACASGGVAVRAAFLAVASGMHNIVVAGGVEKMTDIDAADVSTVLGGAGDQEWELFQGATFPALYALMARKHMSDFGTTEEQMASVAVKNHKNGAKNPYAQFRKEISLETVMKSPYVAKPLKLFDCSPVSDGAAVIVLAPLEIAKKYTDTPIELVASEQASDSLALSGRKSLTGLMATVEASKKAYARANVTPKDIQVAEVHDCFTIAEIMAIEDLGFFEKGKGGKATADGETALNAKISVNTSGGLKACGHPVGATGVKQVCEIFWQLRGEAGERQVSNVNVGLTHNVGGTGATCVVNILKRVN